MNGSKSTDTTPRSALDNEQVVSGWIRCLGIISLLFAVAAGVLLVVLVFGGAAIIAAIEIGGGRIDPQTAILLAAAISASLGAGGIGLLMKRFWAWHAMLLSAIFLVPASVFFTFTFAQSPPETTASLWLENVHYAWVVMSIWPIATFLILCLTPVRTQVRTYR